MLVVVQLEAPVARALREGAAAADALRAAASSLGVSLRAVHPAVDSPPLSTWFCAELDEAEVPRALAGLAGLPGVRAAYAKPTDALPYVQPEVAAARPRDPEETPDYTSKQAYLDEAPGGVDARAAWSQPGGDGAGVGVVDIEGGWRFTHEDLKENKGGVIGGEPSRAKDWRNHGTAVIGVIGGDRNAFGVTGVAPAARVSAVSVFGGTGSAGAIALAAQRCAPGDVILIELHRPGPRARGGGQLGFIAVEWWPDDFDAIRFATGRGVLVVEAAGNGSEDLDHAVYDTPARGFPPDWKNPFRRGERDSGAVLVGAGAPPPGTHGREHGPDRSRLDFSNYGACVDAQGWGREVTTCGYGDLQGGADEDRWYSNTFSGTSSASPVVVGVIACAQGVLKARQRPPLSPLAARALLREGGSPQTDAPKRPAAQRIGPRPDLRDLLARLPAEPPSPDAVDAAWRVAAERLVALARGPVALLAMRHLGAQGDVSRERLDAWLRGEAGDAALRAVMALGLEALAGRAPMAARLSRELRVSAMARLGAMLAGPLATALRGAGVLGGTARAQGREGE